MIRGGFLSSEERQRLMALARDGLAEHRVARPANALVLLNEGWSCTKVAGALLLDDDTVRTWFAAYQAKGVAGLREFGHDGSACRLSEDQQSAFKAWVSETLPPTTKVVGAWLKDNFGLDYSPAGLIALLHRLGFEYCTPQPIPRHLDVARQQAFIDDYEKLLNGLGADEAVMFADAVHPTHQVRPAGCWGPKGTTLAVEQTTGRQSLTIHGAIDLESGKTVMLEVPKATGESAISLLEAVETAHPGKRRLYVYVDHASYHHARIVQEWLKQKGRKCVLRFLPTYCPHLNPIERCWGVMHRHVTHNRDYPTFRAFRREILTFLRSTIPKNWEFFCDRITDNFRVISPSDFRIVA
jgi:transposase